MKNDQFAALAVENGVMFEGELSDYARGMAENDSPRPVRPDKFGVYRKGGSIGDKSHRLNYHPRYGQLIKTHPDPFAARSHAAALNADLSEGEKKHFGMKYHVKPIAPNDQRYTFAAGDNPLTGKPYRDTSTEFNPHNTGVKSEHPSLREHIMQASALAKSLHAKARATPRSEAQPYYLAAKSANATALRLLTHHAQSVAPNEPHENDLAELKTYHQSVHDNLTKKFRLG